MKKFIKIIILLLLVVFPNKVLAEGYISASPSSLTIEQGSAKTFTITAYNAIGDTTIKSENTVVASIDKNEWGTGMVGEKETKTTTITVTGQSVGTTKIIIGIDAATFDSEDLSGQTKTITINVVEKPKPVPTPTPEPTQPSNPQPQQPQVPLSTNNKLKSLVVEGYELTKIDDNNYSLNVSNDTTKIKVTATTEDSKAAVEGNGIKELKVGENTIELVIKSESGAQNKIYIKVNRRDGYYLEDLESLLKKENLKEIDIIINKDSKITKEDITKIKENNKNIKFNYYDENKKLLYSWSIEGNKIRESEEFITTIIYNEDKVEEVYELSNYADGLYVEFKHSGKLPDGTKIKLYVGDKFQNGNIVSVHRYNEQDEKLEFVKDNLKVSDGYIEFDIDHCSNYFVTMSNMGTVTPEKNEETSKGNIFLISTIIEFIIIIFLCLILILKKKKENKESLTENKENIDSNINDSPFVYEDNLNMNKSEQKESINDNVPSNVENIQREINVNQNISVPNVTNNSQSNINTYSKKINNNSNVGFNSRYDAYNGTNLNRNTINNQNTTFNTLNNVANVSNNTINNMPTDVNTNQTTNTEKKIDLNTLVDISNTETRQYKNFD